MEQPRILVGEPLPYTTLHIAAAEATFEQEMRALGVDDTVANLSVPAHMSRHFATKQGEYPGNVNLR